MATYSEWVGFFGKRVNRLMKGGHEGFQSYLYKAGGDTISWLCVLQWGGGRRWSHLFSRGRYGKIRRHRRELSPDNILNAEDRCEMAFCWAVRSGSSSFQDDWARSVKALVIEGFFRLTIPLLLPLSLLIQWLQRFRRARNRRVSSLITRRYIDGSATDYNLPIPKIYLMSQASLTAARRGWEDNSP